MSLQAEDPVTRDCFTTRTVRNDRRGIVSTYVFPLKLETRNQKLRTPE